MGAAARTTSQATVADVLRAAEKRVRAGESFSAQTWTTGFNPLDFHLGGGLRAGELVLLGGPQGLGKTTFGLQMARNVVAGADDASAAYFCFEHGEEQLLQRLLAMEAGLFADMDAVRLNEVRERMEASDTSAGGVVERLGDDPSVVQAVKMLQSYGDRMHLVRARGGKTGLAEIRQFVSEHRAERPVVFVDYLQKVFVPGDVADPDERATRVVEGLKDISLEFEVPVVAIVAADKSGIGPGRTRIHHLRGSTALQYESDVVLMLNNKWDIVARNHLMYGANADRFREYVVLTIEKNRGGSGDVDLEFRTCFEQSRWDPQGGAVTEQLVDDRIVME